MPEAVQSSVRIQRVTTRRRTLRNLECPLEPELLVAEFAGELPPDVALAVREHIAVCETCGARSQALRKPYELLQSLGQEPVTTVPDLRDRVRQQIGKGRLYRNSLRVANAIGRGGAVGIIGAIGIFAVVALVVAGMLHSVSTTVSRSSNKLNGVPPAATSGMLLSLTDKLVTVTDSAGQNWQVAEVISVDQHTATVKRSLPNADAITASKGATNLPMATAVSPDGSTVYELTAPNGRGEQALVAIDTTTGLVRYIVRLTLPGNNPLPAGSRGDALAISSDGTKAYVGLHVANPAQDIVRALVIDDQAGSIQFGLHTQFLPMIPEPPPPGSLPASAFPGVVPHLNGSLYAVSQGANDGIALSPDGKWLFDVLLLSHKSAVQYAVVRRTSTLDGTTSQELALGGDFTLARLTMGIAAQNANAATPTASVPSTSTHSAQTAPLYLVKGSPDAQCYVLDSGITGPTLKGSVALGGPASPEGVVFSGSLNASPSPDGTHLYVTQVASGANGAVSGQDLWLVDAQALVVDAHRSENEGADAVLANRSSTSDAQTFLLRGGAIMVVAPDLSGSERQWVSLSDGHPVIALLSAISG